MLLKYQRISERLTQVSFDKDGKPVLTNMDPGVLDNYVSAAQSFLKRR